MKFKTKKLICLGLTATLILPMAAACAPEDSNNPDNKKTYDNETQVLRMNSGDFDGVFNPFFASSLYDSNIVGQTQISMIGSDEEGLNVTYGPDEPVVTLDYNETMYTAGGEVTETGDQNGTTVYQYVIKNGIKFSDGVELTAHDVLFNMYVYLDRNYTGSSTMYSTKIQGLDEYLSQDPYATESSTATLNNNFNQAAQLRTNAISVYVDTTSSSSAWQNRISTYNTFVRTYLEQYDTEHSTNIAEGFVEYTEDDILADIQTIKAEFRKELESDYNAIDMSTYKEDYSFDSDKIWQGFFYETGVITRKSHVTGGVTIYDKEMVDGKEKFVIDWEAADIDPNSDFTKEEAIEFAYNKWCSVNSDIATILSSWETGGTMLTTFAGDASEQYFKLIANDPNATSVPSISGIKILDASQFKGDTKYESGEYEMLQVTIDGVDPKAKWNFAFTVAPMHYYTTPELYAAAMADEDYSENFGVEMSSNTFMNYIKSRNGLPVGAGVYQASTINDATLTWETNADGTPTQATQNQLQTIENGFVANNVAYFVRNDNFVTTGGNQNEVYNAKIKHMQIKVVATTNVMTSLQGGELDIADPTASIDNNNAVSSTSFLSKISVRSAGYGYIGFNAKFIPDINIRRALMSVMDPGLVQAYYPNGLSEPVYRCFTLESWVYDAFPDDGVEEWKPQAYEDIAFDESFATARYWLQKAGCKYDSGSSTWSDKSGKPLEFTFTIAGDTTDHPAQSTFLKAKEILEKNGIKATVVADARALYKLASGGLAIWAAAWSSSVDPDMYQVYHSDSRATSVLNWGYDYLFKQNNASNEEKGIIEDLDALIEDGRETTVMAERAEIYRDASDLVMELAVELPLYQRSDMYVYNNTTIDASSLNQSPTSYMSPISEIWKVSFITA